MQAKTQASYKSCPSPVGERIRSRVHSNSRFLRVVDTACTDHVGCLRLRTIYQWSVSNSCCMGPWRRSYLANPVFWRYDFHPCLCVIALESRRRVLRRGRRLVSVHLLLRTVHLRPGRSGLGWSVGTGQLNGSSLFRATYHQNANIELFRHVS